MGKKKTKPQPQTVKVETVPQQPTRTYELKFRDFSKNAIRPFKIVCKISSGVTTSRYGHNTKRTPFIPISNTLAVRGRNLYDLESREKIHVIFPEAAYANYIGYVTSHQLHFCIPSYSCFLYDLKTSTVSTTRCKKFIKNYAYSNGWNIENYHDDIYCALRDCLARVQRVKDTRTSIITFKNGDDEQHLIYQGIINQVYALNESQFVGCTDTKVLVFDSISRELKKEYKFATPKRPVTAVFPISPLFIGVVTVSRVRVIEAYTGNIFCESLIDEGCFGANVVMGMDPNTLFIESAGGKQIYILKMISMECGLKDKEYFTDTDFWFRTE